MSGDIHDRLEEIRDRGLYRRMRCVSGPQGPRVLLDGKPVLLLCSNNYLGLADHPRVREAFGRHPDDLAAHQFVTFPFRLLHRPSDELVGRHTRRLRSGSHGHGGLLRQELSTDGRPRHGQRGLAADHGDALARVLAASSFLLDGLAVHDRALPPPDGAVLDVLPPFAGG